MKKKLTVWLLTCCALFTLTACGGGQSAQNTQDTQDGSADPAVVTPAAPSAYAFRTVKGTISVNEDMSAVLAEQGEALSCFEAESCAFDGLDKTYTYAGFVVETRPEGDKDYVNAIRLTDDSVTTQEGVYIGSTAADVTAAYGASEGDGESPLIYTMGDSSLYFIVEDGTVISIEYLPA